MNDGMIALDGNAAAGRLAEIFVRDVTIAQVTCAGCGREGPLATLRLYGGGAGMVLRCPNCDAVNLRLLDTGTAINLDLRGCALMTFKVQSPGAQSGADRGVRDGARGRLSGSGH